MGRLDLPDPIRDEDNFVTQAQHRQAKVAYYERREPLSRGLSEREPHQGARGKPGRSSVALTERPRTRGVTSEASMAHSSRRPQLASAPGPLSESPLIEECCDDCSSGCPLD